MNNIKKNVDYLALLRGINVGGKNLIKMNNLIELFQELGFSDIDTYIQSGNIIFKDLEKEKSKIVKKIENALLEKMNKEIKVLLLTFSEIKCIIDNAPTEFDFENEEYKHDVIFLIEPLTIKDILKEIYVRDGMDKIFEGKMVFYLKRCIKRLTGSYLSKIRKTEMWQYITIRNWNTTKKLYELMLDRKNNM